jgi:UDP-glucose:(heptosyl)LPS alpha-1,3-glucosyltransferase
MRIALVYRSFHLSGSLARETVELARHLSQRHDVHVFSIGERTETSLASECIFHQVPVARLGDGNGFSAAELVSFARNSAAMLSSESFDVVHVCAPSTWVGQVLHVPGVARGEARLQHISSWRFAATTIRHPGNAARLFIEKKAFRNRSLRRIHVEAPSVLHDVVRYYDFAPEDVLVTPPAVNLREFSPPDDRGAARRDAGVSSRDRIVLLFCGSAFRRKGLDRAIEALALVKADAELLVVGSGAEERFRTLARERGVEDRVRFLGRRPDAWRLYHAADILLLPTRADVWGVTPIEAMACAVPPIVSAAAGSSSEVLHGEAGIVLPEPFSLQDLVQAIDRLAGDEALRNSMGRAGTEVARAHSWEKRAAAIEEDFIAIAEGRVGRSARR